ncbi:MAG: outer membrane protein assembly factor BamA, partial [Candidatus Omnitrophica bacterium]|nr:outer membrane protein assembly factor BamA [Candidatus Omnitrophota bacterium]
MIPIWRGPRAVNRIAVVAGVWMVVASAWAQEGKRVIQVAVSGAKTVAKETILAKAQTKAGGPYLDTVVSEDIRRVFALGYFTNVKVDVEELPDGLKLTFVVKEKPTLAAIEVEGNRALRAPRLLELFAVAKGELYDPRKVKEGVDRVKAEYARKGFSQCEMVSRAQVDEASNTATLYLVVDEGSRLRISQILVEGNRAFPDRRIRKVMKTKRRRWFLPGVYDEKVLEEDLDRVRAFYRKHGYQDIQASQAVYRDPAGHGLYVHVTLDEGLQHRVGQVVVDGTVLFPEREIRRVITLKPGAIYSDESLQEDLRLIKQYYGDRGYIHAEVTPDPQLDPAARRVNLTYHVTERELVYVNRIDVQGNLQTKDVVIRRELRVYPGDPFDGAKIRKSLERLYNLGYFEEANVETAPTKAADREDLIVRVKEAKTGSFSFGGGFSSVDRLVGLVELEQRNFDWRNFPQFTGAGQDLRFRTEIGTVRRSFDLSFTEPWIFGHPVSFGIDAYNRTRLRSRNLGLAFEEKQRGGGLRLGKEVTDLVRVGLSYQLFSTEISDVIEEASADLKAEEGTNTISVAGTSVSWDSRDNRLDPTTGWYVFGSANLAGAVIGGDKDFYRLQGGASTFVPHADRFILEGHLRAGIVDAYSDSNEVPIFERFFGGGAGTIRGFRERRVGPRDPRSNDPIGGESTLSATVEEVMTIFKDERGRPMLRGAAFLDVGNVWRRVDELGESFKSGAGAGIRVNTPIGPVRIDLGFPITEEAEGEGRKPR